MIQTYAFINQTFVSANLQLKAYLFIFLRPFRCEMKGPPDSSEGGSILKSSYVNKDLEETRRLLTQVRQGGKRGKKARKKLEAKGIRYYTSEEAESLGIE